LQRLRNVDPYNFARSLKTLSDDIVLPFADESEAFSRAWAKKGADLRVPAPGQAQKIAIMGSLDYAWRKLIVTTSRTKRSANLCVHLHALDRLYGPRRDADKAGDPCPRQWTHPRQQGQPGGAGRTAKVRCAG
jgi:hypothetical protein